MKLPLNECKDNASANITYMDYFNVIYQGRENWHRECPDPCDQTVFKVSLGQYHENNNGADGEKGQALIGKGGVLFSLGYDKLSIEEHVETLVYDTGNFLAQAGGNLGLFVGFSCLSLLLAIINLVKNVCKRFFNVGNIA